MTDEHRHAALEQPMPATTSVAAVTGGGYNVRSAPAPPAMLRGSRPCHDAFATRRSQTAGSPTRCESSSIIGCHGLCEHGPDRRAQRRHAVRPPRAQGRRRASSRPASLKAASRYEKRPLQGPGRPASASATNGHPLLRRADAHRARATGVIDPETRSTTTSRAAATRPRRTALADEDARGDHRRGHRLGPARPRRRRLPDRRQVEVRATQSKGDEQVRHLQRRRGRPRRVHGPLRPRGRPARRARGHDHRAPTPSAPREGYVYVRAEYPLGRRAPRQGASRRPRERGLLGDDILGTRLRLRPAAQEGAGAFVCGEETALIASHRGRARHAAPAAAVPGGQRPLRQADDHQQRRDAAPTCPGSSTQRRRRVRRARHRDLAAAPRSSRSPARSPTAASSRCPWAPPCATSSSTSAAACKRRQGVQGRADRRPLRRLPAGRPARHAGRLREPRGDRRHRGLRRHGRGRRRRPAWSTSPLLPATSRRTRAAASACPAALGTKRMLEMLDRIMRRRRPRGRHRAPRGAGRVHQRGHAVRPRRHGAQPGALHAARTSATSTRRTSARSAARPAVQGAHHLLHRRRACTGCTLCAKKCPTPCITGEKKQPHVIDEDICIKCDTCRQVCNFDAVKVQLGHRAGRGRRGASAGS